MKRLFPLIAWTVLIASTGVARHGYASIETAFDSREMVDRIASASDSNGSQPPQKPHVDEGNPAPPALPSSISPGSLASQSVGLNATFAKRAWKIQLSPQHQVYLKTALQWPTPPPWEILKVPILADSNRPFVR